MRFLSKVKSICCLGTLVLCISCNTGRRPALSETYRSREVSRLTLGLRQLFSQGTVSGNVLTLSEDSVYTLQSCGGLSRGKYYFSDRRLLLYQQFYVPYSRSGADSAVVDTLVYLQKSDGMLMRKMAGYYFKSGKKKRSTLLEELIPE